MDKIEVFNEINKILLNSMKPSEDLKRLINRGYFDIVPFNKIKDLRNIDQNLKFHPEGNVLNHIFLVVDKASEVKHLAKDERVFMWGALLHDIGKLTTTKVRKGRITSYDHDREGKEIGLSILKEVSNDEVFNEEVSKLIRWHMQPLYFDKKLPFFDKEGILEDVDYKEVALLSYCDRLGRGNIDEIGIEEETKKIKAFETFFNGFE